MLEVLGILGLEVHQRVGLWLLWLLVPLKLVDRRIHLLLLSFLCLLLAALYPVNDFLWHLYFEDTAINADFLRLFVFLLRAFPGLSVLLLPSRYLPGSRFRFDWLRGNVSTQCNHKTVTRLHGLHELGIQRPEKDR